MDPQQQMESLEGEEEGAMEEPVRTIIQLHC